MVSNIRETLIIRRYSDKKELLQMQFDVPALTTVNVTYTPPNGYVWFPTYSSAASQPTGMATAVAWADGTKFFEVESSVALEQVLPFIPSMYVKNQLLVTISNLDIKTHTLDMIWGAFLVPQGQFNDFIREMRGDDIKDKMDEQTAVLKQIRDWFMKPLKH